MIVNTDACYKPGTHWVAIYLDKGGIGEYFDSFGLPPLHNEIIWSLRENCPLGYSHNPLTLQGVTSDTCGKYCIAYPKLRLKGYRKEIILNLFCQHPLHNDTRVASWNVLDL